MSKSSSLKATLACLCLSLALAHAAQAQSDVTQPGDPVFASSSNSPGSEGAANAIDNTQAKYLNFDQRTPNNPPTGFAVSPSVGVTRVVGMTVTSANDAPERDPSTILLEGSNDDTITNYNSGTWTTIAGLTNIPAFTARFQKQTFFFDNFTAYKHYRWTVIAVATPNGCCMQVAEVELLGSTLPPDVTQPGDPIVASSSNSPGSEGAANAIDNTQAKYLNFDQRTPNNPPTGFAVTPSIGSSLVSGITVTSANDAPERDPSTFILLGSNDTGLDYNTNNWTFIVGFTNVPAFTARFQKQTFLFDNYTPYKNYRWTVVAVATPNGCCMQVAEVELLGTSAPKDVTQPGDPIVASSSNSPGSEGAANAIDNTQAKYLNFDQRTPNNPPTGFAVAPSIGASTVIGMTITSANDAPERDPSTVILLGSNDAGLDYNTNNWTFVAGITNIPAFTNRFQTQSFYFANKQSYKNYRWTVVAVATPNGCCMQVAEVELLAATSSNPCGQTEFVLQPVNTPALAGTPATFYTKVNGPWTLQWLKNGQSLPGETKTSYSTPPVDATIITNLYSCAIVGCQTSSVVQASIFIPSVTKSVAVSFVGGGANGAPTWMETNDIAGVQAQAYWNNATNSTGSVGVNLPDTLTDSDGNASLVTFEYAATGTWGSGTGTETPTERMLNGLTGTSGAANPNTLPNTFTFHNVPASVNGNSILIYSVSPPLQVQTLKYYISAGTPVLTNYMRILNSDEYKPAPGFYRSTSTTAVNPSVGDFVRFDGIQPDANGDITLSTEVVVGADRETGINGIQLALNAPSPGLPPAITGNPQQTVGPAGGTVTLSVTASGNNLTYQWRKNGVNLSNGPHVTGVTTAVLKISSLDVSDEAFYSCAVFNPAGSVVSKNASVKISTYNINTGLAAYWPLDPTTGTIAPNAVSGGQVAVVNGTANWLVPGKITNAFSFDQATYLFVTNYPKASGDTLSASAWVNVDTAMAGSGIGITFVQNSDGALRQEQTLPGGGISGQFTLGLVPDALDPNLFYLRAAIMVGPNRVAAVSSTPFTFGTWQQVAFSADGAQLHLYRNGVEVASADYVGKLAAPSVQYLSMGAVLSVDYLTDPANPIVAPDATANYMGGPLDDVAIWNRSLSAEEVSKVYAQGLVGKPVTSVTQVPPAGDPVISSTTIAGGVISITWLNGGTLETAPTPSGAWTTTGNSSGSFSEPVAAGNKFYRVKR